MERGTTRDLEGGERLSPQRGNWASGPDTWGRPPSMPLTVVRTAVWAACHFVFYFAQQVAELFAPLLLVAGIGWAMLPHLLDAVTAGAAAADPQAREMVGHLSTSLPERLIVSGHVLTPSSLIFDGIVLMAVAAAGATLAAFAGRKL